MAAPKAPVIGGSKAQDVSLEEAVFAVELKPHLVHEVDTERNLLLVRGSVPGAKGGIVEIRSV